MNKQNSYLWQKNRVRFVLLQIFQPMTAQLGNVECHTVFWLLERISEGQSTPKGQNNGRRKSLFQFKCPSCFSHVVWEPRVNNFFPQERFMFLSRRNGIESFNNSDWQTSFFSFWEKFNGYMDKGVFSY